MPNISRLIMNIVQLNQYIEKIARCIQIVHSYSSQSPYEYWNAKGDVQYGSVCFCIKKSRMRSNTITYDAILYYGDRVVDTPSNKEQIWSDANNVIQNIVGTINMQSDGEVSVSYPYDITNFEQKFADNLAGAYATLSIETKGIGECGDLLYGYEEEDKIKLESIVKTITVNGEYDITSSKDYDAISDVKVIVNVAPDPKDTFASIGYNDENAGGFLNQFSDKPLTEDPNAKKKLNSIIGYLKSNRFKKKVNSEAYKTGVPPKKVAQGVISKAFGLVGDILGIAVDTVSCTLNGLVDLLSNILHRGIDLVTKVVNGICRIVTFNQTACAS